MNLKVLGLLLLVFITSSVFAQQKNEVVIGSELYDQLKQEGKLGDYVLKLNESSFSPSEGAKYKPKPSNFDTKSDNCDCYVEPDGTYTVAMAPNDDGSSSLINIPFNFNFYGQTFTSFYINNNGNITFENDLFAFSSNAFPSSPDQIIAPFWADVDTRNGNGQVVYKITPTAVYINWEDVGYYSMQGDKLNTFQMIITDGTDPVIPDGNNVAFCYQDMQWTTGSASQGVNGFEGIPATCGANKGDNIAYFLIARFDHAGNDFDGALGNPDGISWLDNKSFFFDVTNSGNVPPIPEGVAACDTFKVCSFGDTADISINFFAPEANQTTSITYSDGGLTSLQEVANISGNTAQLILRIIGDPADAGEYTINVTATDDFVPAGVTSMNFVIVIEDGGVVLDPVIDFTPACDSIELSVLNGPFDSYLWDDLVTQPTTYTDGSGMYGVTVSLDNCYKRVEEYIHVPTSATFGLQGNLYLCPGEDSTLIVIGDSLAIDIMDWDLGIPALDGLFQNWLTPGTYTIFNTDSTGLCVNDTTFTIGSSSPSTIFNDTISCTDLNFQSVGAQAGTDAIWSSPDAEISFSNTSISNPLITTTNYGVYTVNLSTPCEADLTAEITFPAPPQIFGDTTICEMELTIPLSQISTFGNATWSATPSGTFAPAPNQSATTFTVTTDGIYELELTDNTCPNKSDVVFVEVKTPPTVNIPALGCDLTTFELNATYPNDGAVTWTFIDNPGTPFLEDTAVTFLDPTTSTTQNPFVNVSHYGSYTVAYNITGDCPLNGTGEIYFPPYIFTEINDTNICIGVEYQLGAFVSPYDVDYSWSTGATGVTSIIVSTPGIYTVTIENECYTFSDEAVIETYMCDIEAPNVISLSSTSGNETWYVQADGIADFECFIVNRWGNLIYEFNDINAGWNGQDMNGRLVEDGVYFYSIKAKAYGGEEVLKHGSITVVR